MNEGLTFALSIVGTTAIILGINEYVEKRKIKTKEKNKQELDKKWESYFNKEFGVIEKD